MTSPVQAKVQCISPSGLHRMAYSQWGDAGNPDVILCLHGMVRCGRDFDALAASLCADYRVVAPDFTGRGASDWLADPAGYTVEQYVADIITLLARLAPVSLTVVGTSLGGVVGIALASLAGTPVSRLVINDVGPAMEAAALERLVAFLATSEQHDKLSDAVARVKEVSSGFGSHTKAQWEKLARDVLVRNDKGKWVRRHDPRIVTPLMSLAAGAAAENERRLWQAYDAVRCPTLLLRGAQSDMLSVETARRMTERGPKPQLVEFEGVGHAPTLLDDAQIDAVARFLRQGVRSV